MQHSGMAKPEYLLAERQQRAYLRDAVIGPVDLDGCFVFSGDVCDEAGLLRRAFVWKG